MSMTVTRTRTACPRTSWVPTNARRSCNCCGKSFSVLRWRHRCRVCGDIVCSKCSVEVVLRNEVTQVGKSCVVCAITPDSNEYLDLAAAMQRRPTCPMFVDLLPSMKWKDVAREHRKNGNCGCTICLDDYKGLDNIMQLPCHHTYHTKCITRWLETNDECPVCRYSLPRDVSFACSISMLS
ncbi:hypothetical protein THRCLA_20803 [Thraustotheca clavata]|uniref:RING-type domain-containing protein n=1 Tax=Thraustotheca clavata TaxID=74557 RepID=A0A1W0A3J3_9STRA|nr:hypothetical protein THRCLA_20803 [Thraustotheca clavata]